VPDLYVIAFVDFDNLYKRVVRHSAAAGYSPPILDYILFDGLPQHLISIITHAIRIAPKTTCSIKAYLYGGWRDGCGNRTLCALSLLRAIHHRPVRMPGIRVRYEVKEYMASDTELIMHGTHANARQKMVDTMLCLDVLYYTLHEAPDVILLVSSDSDVVPSLLVLPSFRALIRHHGRCAGGLPYRCLLQPMENAYTPQTLAMLEEQGVHLDSMDLSRSYDR